VSDPAVPIPGVPLAGFSSLGIGGPAAWLLDASSVEDVARAHDWCVERALPLLVVGGGSNLVVADRGFAGLVVRMEIRERRFTQTGGDTIVSVGAGESWDAFVAEAVTRGLSGIECLSGIPGSVGGTPIQNVGAYGQEVATTIQSVEVFDRDRRVLTALPANACGFGYRMSRFKRDEVGRFIVCRVTFRLGTAAASVFYPDVEAELRQRNVSTPAVADVRAAVLAVRRRKGMVLDAADPDSRSVGSFFMNPIVSTSQYDDVAACISERPPMFSAGPREVKIPAAWLIERAGFRKGHVDGPVGVSSKHPLAIINRGGARAADVVRLAVTIKRRVHDRFGVSLRPEPTFVGFDDDADVEYLMRSVTTAA